METTVRTKAGVFSVGESYELQGLNYLITKIDAGDIADRLYLSEEGADATVDTTSAEKEIAIKTIIVEYKGMKFSADDISRSRMHQAIDVMKANGLEEYDWKIEEEYNGSITTKVTTEDLFNIMGLGLKKLGEIVL